MKYVADLQGYCKENKISLCEECQKTFPQCQETTCDIYTDFIGATDRPPNKKRKIQPSLVPPELIEAVARIIEDGEKIHAGDWRDITEKYNLDAIGRHYLALLRGEKIDQDSGESHYGLIATRCAFNLARKE